MKIYIDKDERYPDFFISDTKTDYVKEVDAPEDLMQRYEDACNEYEAIQIELENLYNNG